MGLSLGNLGIAAGAGVTSYLAARADYRAQDEADSKKRESDRVEKMRKEEDGVRSTVSAALKKRLEVKDAPASPVTEPAALPGVPAASPQSPVQGIAPETAVSPQTPAQGIAPPAEQMNGLATPAPAAAGIAVKPEKNVPTYRPMTRDDGIWAAGEEAAEWSKVGNFEKAGAAMTRRLGFVNEKVNEDTAARGAVVDQALRGFATGDYSGVARAFSLVPNGKEIPAGGLVENKDGSFTIVSQNAKGEKSEPVQFPNKRALANALESLKDPAKVMSWLKSEDDAKIKESNDAAERKQKKQTGDAAQLNSETDAQYKDRMGRAALITAEANETKAEKAKAAAAPKLRELTNDGINQLTVDFGGKLDALGKIMDTDSIKDQPGYRAARAELEHRVYVNGELPASVSKDLSARYARAAEEKKLGIKGGANPAASGVAGKQTQSAPANAQYPTPWKK